MELIKILKSHFVLRKRKRSGAKPEIIFRKAKSDFYFNPSSLAIL